MALNTAQYNEVLSNIQTKIPSNCDAYRDIQDKSQKSTPVLGKTTFTLSDYEAYRNDIEFVNVFNEQLLVDEKNYFEKKYSVKLYQYLLSQRQSYREEQSKLKKESMCESYIETISDLKKKPCENKDNSTSNNNETESGSGNLMSYLMAQNPIQNPETTYKKIEYRKEAHEWLSTLNNWMTILYFVILLVMLVMLAVSNKLLLKERFMLYVFLVVLPFAFPYLFQLLKYLFGYIFPDSSSHGPKNAFLDTKINLIDSYNV
jgi:hypothetical protein